MSERRAIRPRAARCYTMPRSPAMRTRAGSIPITGMAACQSSGSPVAAAPSRSSAMTRGAGCCGTTGAAVRWRACSTTVTCTPADRTRGFREWRLLRVLAALDLPAPRPVAARYRRNGIFYRADLLTVELPSRATLAQVLVSDPLPMQRWSDIGRCIGRFHAHGVRHADLNANNIVLGPAREVYLLDFDRGRIVARGAWEVAVLARLERSLVKVTQALPAGRYGPEQWQLLLDACRRA